LGRRGHVHTVMLAVELDLAIIDVQHRMRIGTHAAILYMVNEGLRKNGYIDEPTYELFKARYSKPLKDILKEKREEENAPRCSWAEPKCRRIATVVMKRGDRVIPSCPKHLKEFQRYGYEVLEEA